MDVSVISNRELDREVWTRVLGKPLPVGLFTPSTDMNHAMDVVATLHRRTLEATTGRLRGGFTLCVLDEKYGRGWLATFESYIDLEGEHYEQADTPARAICAAALRAVQRCERLQPRSGT